MRLTQVLRGTASVAVLATFAAAAAPSVALAQAGASAGDDGINSVSEIIVTANKREQNLQDVPVVVTALSEEMLQGAGVRDIKDLQILTPGLTVTSTTSETITTARIRGVGTVGDNPGLESSVGVIIDGVYRPRNGVGFGDLGELERIEVLKGPQGTLFGKNTSAGVINVITKAPSFDFGAEGEASFGNYGQQGFSGSVTGPLNDQLALRLYAATRQRDGFYDVITGDGPRTLREDQDQDFWTIRGQALFQPSDTVSLRFIADYTKRDEHCCVGVNIRSTQVASIVNSLAAGGQGIRPPAAGNAILPWSRTAYANRDTNQMVEDAGASIEANIDFPSWNATFTSITALRSWESVNGMDVDFSGADVLYRAPNGDFGFSFDTFSHEMRLAGTSDRIDWLVGGFFADENLSRRDSYIYGADYEPFLGILLSTALGGAPNPQTVSAITGLPFGTNYPTGSGARDLYLQHSKTYAVFTDNTIHVTDAFDVTLGLRFTDDSKSVGTHQMNYGGNGNACAAALGRAGTQAGQVSILSNLLGVPASVIVAPPSPQIAAQIQALGANLPTLVARTCLPWANAGFNNRATAQESSEQEISGTVKGAYRFNEDVMVYASYARGYKSGGFNLDRVLTGVTPDASTYFPPETVDSYELGAKTTWLNGSLLLNATVFHQTYNDFQLNAFLGTAFVVQTLPEVTSKGVDADMVWFTPVEDLTIQGGVTYADTKIGDFTAADVLPGRFQGLSLLPGNTLSFAPEWSASASVAYEPSLGGNLKGIFNLSAKYMSDYNTGSDLVPFKEQAGYTLLNGRIGVGAANDLWRIELWGQNLTDEEYYQVAYNAPLQGSTFPNTTAAYNPATDTQTYNAFLGQPRTYGITLRVRY
jgi:outer membrane receptor protein involved in Fe transport